MFPHSLCAPLLSHVWLFVTSWTIDHQALLSMEFSRQEYWSGLPFSSPGALPNPGIESVSIESPHWQADSLPPVLPGKPFMEHRLVVIYINLFPVTLYLIQAIGSLWGYTVWVGVGWEEAVGSLDWRLGFWSALSSVQSLSHVQLFVTLWTAVCHTSLSITNSWS